MDDSPGAGAALVQALIEAGRRRADLAVVAAFTMEPVWVGGAPIDVPDVDAAQGDALRRLREMVEGVRRDAVVTAAAGAADVGIRLIVELGPAARVLVERARDADLLVVGSRGRGGLRSAFLGSVALHCVTHASCPVEVVHANPVGSPEEPRVVVGVDGSAASRAALGAAVGEAVLRGAVLDVVVSYQMTDYWTDLGSVIIPSVEQIRADLRQRAEGMVADVLAGRAPDSPPPSVRVVVTEGPAGDVLLHHGRTADLLVVGSRGHGAFRGLLLGSVALYAAMHATCPVLVVHPPMEQGAEAPVLHEPALAEP